MNNFPAGQISNYEWDYRKDINDRMRVPEKISLTNDTLRSKISEEDFSQKTNENMIANEELNPISHTPGFSPDLSQYELDTPKYV
ncbi:hypothetical protein Ciccas_011845 [Cichlidogyrus casuarinus]|uniref:Mff-like domain-containing protein n=1 Tax=Cichlidogyrus casuarinus TaxID=1844966 RepID=A0ABD2PRT0_9PLAT